MRDDCGLLLPFAGCGDWWLAVAICWVRRIPFLRRFTTLQHKTGSPELLRGMLKPTNRKKVRYDHREQKKHLLCTKGRRVSRTGRGPEDYKWTPDTGKSTVCTDKARAMQQTCNGRRDGPTTAGSTGTALNWEQLSTNLIVCSISYLYLPSTTRHRHQPSNRFYGIPHLSLHSACNHTQ